MSATHHVLAFPFASDWRYRWATRCRGVTAATAKVSIITEAGECPQLHISFGSWHIATPMSNLAEATESGLLPACCPLAAPEISRRDRMAIFATTTRNGVTLDFAQPVYAFAPETPSRIEQVRKVVVTVADVLQLLIALDTAAHGHSRRIAAPPSRYPQTA